MYTEWGAIAKLDKLAEEFPGVIEEASAQSGSFSSGIISGSIRARERFKTTSNDKHFAKVSDLCSQERRDGSSYMHGSSPFLHDSTASTQTGGGSSSFFRSENSTLLPGLSEADEPLFSHEFTAFSKATTPPFPYCTCQRSCSHTSHFSQHAWA
uniref:Uncharacterized protein n=1 Tax=Grammatophora oceanica TaxID=210454 RepID=A0A7S1VGC2_9STRA